MRVCREGEETKAANAETGAEPISRGVKQLRVASSVCLTCLQVSQMQMVKEVPPNLSGNHDICALRSQNVTPVKGCQRQEKGQWIYNKMA